MALGASGTKSFARILITQARELVTPVDAIAISGNRRSLDWDQGHLVFPCRQDITVARLFSQAPATFTRI